MTCTINCRCGCPENAHTGAFGVATACTGLCGCSFYEPNLPDVTDAERAAEPVDYRALFGMGLPNVDGLVEAYAEVGS